MRSIFFSILTKNLRPLCSFVFISQKVKPTGGVSKNIGRKKNKIFILCSIFSVMICFSSFLETLQNSGNNWAC